MAQRIVVGNWKMNQSLEAIKKFFVEIQKLKASAKCEMWIAPQAIHVPIVKEFAFNLGLVQVGAQNCSDKESGAFTGETSPQALNDLGVSFVIIGHSERRTIFNESNTLLNAKLQTALKNGLNVIYCVGETLTEREQNKTFNVIETQLMEGLKNLPQPNDYHNIVIAYEPVWAIGTGKTATLKEVNEVHAFIRKLLKGQNLTLPILYGGSVNTKNAQELFSSNEVDGALVGGASLKGEDFVSLCQSASIFA